MGCTECENAQSQGKPAAYYRVESSNIRIVGCKEHIRKTVNKLRKADGLEEKPLKDIHILPDG